MKNRIIKYIELVVLFVIIPLLYRFDLIPVHKFIPLLATSIYCLIILLADKKFDRKKLGFNKFRDKKTWKLITTRFAVLAVISIPLVYYFLPDLFFILPKKNIFLWTMIMLFYPIFSVYPQELIYRTFFYERYVDLFKNQKLMVFSNAVLFMLAHLIFRNYLALVLTFIAGFMFSYTYLKSNSTMTIFIEHTFYGNWVFTVGAGQMFYLPLSH